MYGSIQCPFYVIALPLQFIQCIAFNIGKGALGVRFLGF